MLPSSKVVYCSFGSNLRLEYLQLTTGAYTVRVAAPGSTSRDPEVVGALMRLLLLASPLRSAHS